MNDLEFQGFDEPFAFSPYLYHIHLIYVDNALASAGTTRSRSQWLWEPFQAFCLVSIFSIKQVYFPSDRVRGFGQQCSEHLIQKRNGLNLSLISKYTKMLFWSIPARPRGGITEL